MAKHVLIEALRPMRGPGHKRLKPGDRCHVQEHYAGAMVRRGFARFVESKPTRETKPVRAPETKVVAPPETKADPMPGPDPEDDTDEVDTLPDVFAMTKAELLFELEAGGVEGYSMADLKADLAEAVSDLREGG